MSAAQEDIYRDINEPIGKLKLCCGVNLGISLIAPLLGKFIQQYPKLEIELVLDNNLPNIYRDGFDVIFHDRVEGYEFLIGHQICSYDMVACASPEYLHKYGIPKHPKELEHHQCLKHSTTYHAHRWCFKGPDGEYSLPIISSRFTINSGQAMLAAAKEGAGIVIQPRLQVQDDLHSGALIQILSSYVLPEIELFMLYKPSLRNTSRLILLNDFFMKSMCK
nr:substrate binding domain-containing protein [Photobacterium damselae]